ncbi:MAG: HU family DNA-binding protein [Gammaproteobacteria bacterium]|nr:HU family DNA-binding protein [Gammaproteobacteria bacterium]
MAAKKKAAAKKKTAKKTAAAQKPPTKSEIFSNIADETGLTKKEVASVFEALNGQIKKNVGRRGPGLFTVPGLMKIKVIKKPATKARKGINPFTGEETVFKAKPARKAVKVLPLKGLKDMV